MIREICRDETFLAQKAAPATADDLATAQDLLDTLTAHKDGCVGMAANMIGVCKRIIAFDNERAYMVMFNPVIIRQSEPYEAEEGCLSLTGTRRAKRFRHALRSIFAVAGAGKPENHIRIPSQWSISCWMISAVQPVKALRRVWNFSFCHWTLTVWKRFALRVPVRDRQPSSVS